MRNNSYKLKWYYEYNIQEGNNIRSYPNVHLYINYVRSFQEICIYFDRARHPNGRQ